MQLRTKAVLTTSIFLLVYGVLQFIELPEQIQINQLLVKAVVVALLFFFGLYWVLGFNVKGIRFLTILGNASVLVFIQALFLEVIVFQNVGRISQKTFSLGVLLLFGVALYFLILTVNILNVSFVSDIPLARAAKASNFIYTLLSAYFAFLLILKSGVVLPIQIAIFVFIIFFLTFNTFWFKRESRKQHFWETVAVVVCMIALYSILLLWPLSVEISAMIFTVVYYVLLGLGIEERATTSTLMRVEYLAVLILALFLLLKLANWGINGPIL